MHRWTGASGASGASGSPGPHALDSPGRVPGPAASSLHVGV